MQNKLIINNLVLKLLRPIDKVINNQDKETTIKNPAI